MRATRNGWYAAVLLALSACGSDGESGGDGGTGDGSVSPDAGSGGPDASRADAHVPIDGHVLDGDLVDSTIGTSEAGSDSAVLTDAGSGDVDADKPYKPSPVPATTGPVSIMGTIPTINGPVAIASGIAFFDPTDEVGASSPELRIYFTSWPVSGCEPSWVEDQYHQGFTGRVWARLSIARQRTHPPYIWTVHNGETGTFGFGAWHQAGASGFLVSLTSGDDNGGEQVVGKIQFTESYTSAVPTGEEIQFRVNHCGIIDTPNW